MSITGDIYQWYNAAFYWLHNYFWIKCKGVKYGEHLSMLGKVWFHGAKNSISIGNNVTIISTPGINPTAGGVNTHFRTVGNGRIIIGNGVGITRAEITSFDEITIEDDVLIGGNCKIWDTDFHSLVYSERMKATDNDVHVNSVRIEKGAFIGAGSYILKGVVIGEYSIVGAGSVVTHNIPPMEIWAGNPARFIKKIEKT